MTKNSFLNFTMPSIVFGTPAISEFDLLNLDRYTVTVIIRMMMMGNYHKMFFVSVLYPFPNARSVKVLE